jgi:hypothetical protein
VNLRNLNKKILSLYNHTLSFQGVVLGKEDDSNSYLVKRRDLPGIQSVILRDDIFLKTNRKPLKDADVS